MKGYKMVAKTLFGFEDLLYQELKDLGATKIEKGIRMVSFYGDKGFMYKANLSLRTALRILVPIASKKVFSEKGIYDLAYGIDWSKYLNTKDTFAVQSTVHSTLFNHSKFVALKVKDAIVDQFRDRFQERPSIDIKHPKLSVQVHIHEKYCTISLDSSGESLHKRGYRVATNIAPINEVLAAGLLMHSGWKGQSDFLDPMCGSGTILIEAAMIACRIPCNMNRKEFAFEHWKDWDVDLYERIEESLLKKIIEFPYKMIGYDKAPSAVRKSIDNIESANLSDFIEVVQKDFFESTKEDLDRSLHLLTNPPYGERLPIHYPDFYKEIGDTLKQEYPNTNAWIVSSALEDIKHLGLRPSRKIKCFNAKLESRLFFYPMYSGSKKAKFNK